MITTMHTKPPNNLLALFKTQTRFHLPPPPHQPPRHARKPRANASYLKNSGNTSCWGGVYVTLWGGEELHATSWCQLNIPATRRAVCTPIFEHARLEALRVASSRHSILFLTESYHVSPPSSVSSRSTYIHTQTHTHTDGHRERETLRGREEIVREENVCVRHFNGTHTHTHTHMPVTSNDPVN